jgi:hypothetical protein
LTTLDLILNDRIKASYDLVAYFGEGRAPFLIAKSDAQTEHAAGIAAYEITRLEGGCKSPSNNLSLQRYFSWEDAS